MLSATTTYCYLTVIEYPKRKGFWGLLSMPIFYIVLFIKKNIVTYKLLGCGKNGRFSVMPDPNMWAILTAVNEDVNTLNFTTFLTTITHTFIYKWLHYFGCKATVYKLLPLQSHGNWSGKNYFKPQQPIEDYKGKIAVITRATIKIH